MVVEGANDARLAIELDGDEFHGPHRWQADISRQRALERASWIFWRLLCVHLVNSPTGRAQRPTRQDALTRHRTAWCYPTCARVGRVS
ncbi:hypothetical protein [Burkholderia ubonensis]|uniref:hypothetical protein n=1 Tax=Burkholderia ubonensis TaxID=101571 RepID=UPI001E633874|nr:hypothetical protein [Burkholderia ubonensis]